MTVADVLFAHWVQNIICRGDGTVVMLLSRGGGNLAVHQAVEHQVPYHPRPFLLDDLEGLLVWGGIFHAHDLLGMNLAIEIGDRIGALGRVFAQARTATLVALHEFGKDLVPTGGRFRPRNGW